MSKKMETKTTKVTTTKSAKASKATKKETNTQTALSQERERIKSLFADNLERFMKEKGKQEQELASAAGVSLQTFRRWERGESLPGVDHFLMLAKALELPTIQELIKE